MSKQRFDIRLKNNNGQEYFTIDGSEEKRSSEELIQLLKNGVRTGTIKTGIVKKDSTFTKYIFDVESYDDQKEETLKGKFVVRVANYEKKDLKSLDSIEILCDNCYKTKKINFYRIVAGVLVTITLATVTGPTIVKGLDKLLQKDQEYEDGKAQTTISIMEEYEEQQRALMEHKNQMYEEAQEEKEIVAESYKGMGM